MVEQLHLPVRRALAKIGIAPTALYLWYDRVVEHGSDGIEGRPRPPHGSGTANPMLCAIRS